MAYRVDWGRIEPGWRLGVKSVLQLSADYEAETGKKVSHTAISKHFRGLGIPRNLNAKVQAKAQALVAAAEVAKRVLVETSLSDALIVNEIAKDVAAIQLSQRKDITKAMGLSSKLLQELESQTDNAGSLEKLGEMMFAPSENGYDKLNEIYKKVIATPARIDSMKKLAETLKTLVGLEREAWGIDEAKKEAPTTVVARIELVPLGGISNG